MMRSKWLLVSVLLLGLLLGATAGLSMARGRESGSGAAPQALLGTGFTYQGKLNRGGSPHTGTCDLRFSLHDAQDLGSQIGSPQTIAGVNVEDGLFTVVVNSGNEFGIDAFQGQARWLAIEVKCSGDGSYTPLEPRQALTPAPYALAMPGLWTQQNAFSPNIIGGHGGNGVGNFVVGATIAGGGQTGYPNRVWANFGSVGGGDGNNVQSQSASIGGGVSNSASGLAATIGGGGFNSTGGLAATVGGGISNTAVLSHTTVGGGYGNSALGQHATVSGGAGSEARGNCATVSGGDTNRATDDYATVGGGGNNQAGNASGGTDDATYATVGGGAYNRADEHYATVAGGVTNLASGWYSAVAGGQGNDATASNATVGGGEGNRAIGQASTVCGGYQNTASGFESFACGGSYNSASAEGAVALGGRGNRASGMHSFAAGYHARARHGGSFVWADATSGQGLVSTGDNQFVARASGGVWLWADGAASTGVVLPAGGGSWANQSDREAKAGFAAVNGMDIVERLAELPIEAWSYETQDAAIRHIGPSAQEFYAAFGVGEDDKHISTVDADGVALAAIQGLYALLQERDAQVADLEARLTALEQRVGTSGSSRPSVPGGWLLLGGLVVVGLTVGRWHPGGER
jgi:hypothetical protein